MGDEEQCDCYLCQINSGKDPVVPDRLMKEDDTPKASDWADPYEVVVEETETFQDGSASFAVTVGPGMAAILIQEGILSIVRKRAEDILVNHKGEASK